jgi:Transposase DDE domain group 1
MGKATRLVRPRTVTGDGEGLVSHAGLVWLGEVADRSGLTAGLSQVLAGAPRRRHDPGVCLAQLVVALADGAECLSDLEVFRGQPELFGPVPSRSSAQRAFTALGPAELRRLAGARAQARTAAWEAGAGPDGEGATIDLDATIVRTRSDKEDAAPTHKRTYGHHPLGAMLAETGEVLAGMFRPGNAGANCAADHVVVLGAAIDQLPPEWQAGHQPGDEAALVTKDLLVRTDSAGASHWFAEECRDRNIGFTLGYWIDGRVRDALLLVQEEDWEPAREADGRVRDGAQVHEITHLVNLDAWPAGTRLIVRRERPHPGAQLSLFDTIEGFRHTAFITDTPGEDLAALDLRHRQRGRAEQIIRDTKACGLARLPFDGAANNDRWMQLTFTANDLLCWARRISLTGPLRRATPKTIRHRLLHTAAHLSPRRLHLDASWPWTPDLLDAIDRLKTRLQPPPRSVPIRPAIHPGL